MKSGEAGEAPWHLFLIGHTIANFYAETHIRYL